MVKKNWNNPELQNVSLKSTEASFPQAYCKSPVGNSYICPTSSKHCPYARNEHGVPWTAEELQDEKTPKIVVCSATVVNRPYPTEPAIS